MSGDVPGETPPDPHAGVPADEPAVVRSVLDAAGVGVVVTGPDGTVERVDERVATYFGVSPGAAGVDRAAFLDAHVRPCLDRPAAFDDAAGTEPDGESVPCHVLPGTDREERWLRYDSHRITEGRLAGGRIDQFVDVTDERAATQRAVYERTVEHAEDPTVLVETDLAVGAANGPAQRLGLSPRDDESSVLALADDLLVGDGDPGRFERALEDCLEGTDTGPETVEVRLDGPDDTATYRVRCSALSGPGNAAVLVTAREVSNQRARARQYETLVENFPNGAVTLVDESLEYRLAGGKLFERLSETPADVEGTHVGEVDAGDRAVFVDSYRAALDGESVTVETTLRDRVLVHRALPVRDDDGTVRAAIGLTQDVTERVDRERELERNREFLREIQEVADVGGWEVDLRSETLRWTDEVYRIHDLSTEYVPTVEEALGFYHPDDRDRITEAYRRLTEEHEPYDLELRLVTATDEVRWVRTLGKPVTDDGEVVGARGTFQDITERRENERELRRKSRALDEAPVGVTITDPSQDDNPIIYANETFLDVTGYDREAVLGRNCRFLQGEDTGPEPVADLRAAIDDEHPVAVDLCNYRADGTPFWNHVEVAPVRDESGALANYVGFQQDVTEQKERQRELAQTKERLDVALEETDTGVWVLRFDEGEITPLGSVSDLFGVDSGTSTLEAYVERIHPEDRPAVERDLAQGQRSGDRFDVEFRVRRGGEWRWLHGHGKVRDDERAGRRIVGVTTDVTDRKRREQALEKRERVLRELHAATREFYPPGSLTDISEFLVEFLEGAFEFDYVSVKRFDEDAGALEPVARSPAFGAGQVPGAVSPGDGPVWEAYRADEPRIVDGAALGSPDLPANQALVVPIGDFGVVLALTTGDGEFDAVDRELIEVVTANAESAFQRLHSDRVRTEITEELSTQQAKVDELRGVIDAIQSIQHRLATSESREALETGVCEELVEADRVDFAWVGRPQSDDTDLAPTAWAGEGDGYLDSVETGSGPESLPARRAAVERELYCVPDVARQVFDEPWAKEALSFGFKSALSVPLVYDDVLYGVVTAYSRVEDAFDGMYRNLFTDVGSLLVNYSRLLDSRYANSRREHTELEFELTETTDPLGRLASEAGARIRYDTVAEHTDDAVRCLVTVEDGDVDDVADGTRAVASIVDAERFGTDEPAQFSLTVKKPFLASEVAKHGGRILEATSTAAGTTFRVAVPRNVSRRPLLDSLTSRYPDIDLVAQRQTTRSDGPDLAAADELLTDRQCEILNAAYYGGYYETPRGLTGEDLAESFGISSPAVYNHLQAAHRKLLERVFEPGGENQH